MAQPESAGQAVPRRTGARHGWRRHGWPGPPVLLPARSLPPGQHIPRTWPVLHYGPVPAFDPAAWDLRVIGATASGEEHRFDRAGFAMLPRCRVVADFHCVTKLVI